MDILKLGDKAKYGQPAWYDLGQNGIAHYVPNNFVSSEEIPKTLCNRTPTIITTSPLSSGELEDLENPEYDEWIYKICKHCLRKLKIGNSLGSSHRST